jgi:hypothetical protein
VLASTVNPYWPSQGGDGGGGMMRRAIRRVEGLPGPHLDRVEGEHGRVGAEDRVAHDGDVGMHLCCSAGTGPV